MKHLLSIIAALLFCPLLFSQISYLQYRVVPADKQQEFEQKETEHWSKVAKAAVDQGNMVSWSLWRKVGVTNQDAPNYVFVNTFESLEKMDPAKVWSEENLSKMGMKMEDVETNSFAPVPFDYFMQLEAMIPGEYQYALVNYAMPTDLAAFIEENKTLWQPLHKSNIESGNMGMSSWGMMSVIYPQGHQARFSVMTWDGFNSLADAMNYLRYQPAGETTQEWQKVMDQTKMGELIPDGFVWRVLYERVMTVAAEE
ncbi:hypothetical protein [Robertkochia aurantiaca]|uniref:hypothetical protein n=1 Tax=Robertkochia aurantiaca TaxID=2873700 RepID=UPI001CCEBE96|nr:hypothetical protein [Robertkochia sp. 3YJGBD-33]